jgi:hypothetical protein
VVVDERLAALRRTPQLNGHLVRRLGRGRLVAITGARTAADGIIFYRVNVTRKTNGWVQREAVVSPHNRGEDQRLLNLIKNSAEFDRISRARIFLAHFPRSTLRPEVLLLLGDTAEQAAIKLSRDARNRLGSALSAPEFSYYLNYSGLDRYNRQGVRFVFETQTKRFRYDGEAWHEIVRRYPHSSQAAVAKLRLKPMTIPLP